MVSNVWIGSFTLGVFSTLLFWLLFPSARAEFSSTACMDNELVGDVFICPTGWIGKFNGLGLLSAIKLRGNCIAFLSSISVVDVVADDNGIGGGGTGAGEDDASTSFLFAKLLLTVFDELDDDSWFVERVSISDDVEDGTSDIVIVGWENVWTDVDDDDDDDDDCESATNK